MTEQLQAIIEKLEGEYKTLPKPIEIKTHFPFAIFTFTGAWGNGHTVVLVNDDPADYWIIDEEEDSEIIEILYNQFCEQRQPTTV